MMVVNTETVPGKRIVEVKGLVQGNTVRAAYNEATLLQERTRMMQWYADELDRLARPSQS